MIFRLRVPCCYARASSRAACRTRMVSMTLKMLSICSGVRMGLPESVPSYQCHDRRTSTWGMGRYAGMHHCGHSVRIGENLIIISCSGRAVKPDSAVGTLQNVWLGAKLFDFQLYQAAFLRRPSGLASSSESPCRPTP